MDGSMVCWIYLLWSVGGYVGNSQQITLLEKFKQQQVLKKAYLQCQERHNSTLSTLTGLYCNRTWDNVTCWDDAPAGEVIHQPCPSYINGFDQGEFATKECLADGTWSGYNGSSKPWTNYSTCSKGTLQPLDHLITEHVPRVKLMYTIGYSVSLTFLILAVAIMVYFKRLHCPRNMIHLNLFLAVLVRAGISLMKGVLLVNDVGFPGDVTVTPTGQTIFLEGPHWECRLFFTLFNYAIMTNLFWIFNEGLYLQLILSISVFAEKTKLRWFVLLGWGMPILFVIPWAMVRLYLDNTMCWNVHQTHPKLYWIIKGPMAVSVVINFIFFINIVRLLFTKLSASNCHESRTFRYRRLAKSIVILIPLFAVYYMGFIWLPEDLGTTGIIIKLYIEIGFNSFQGFFVAMLFCFLNTEVQTEIKKKWQRQVLRRASSIAGRSAASMHHRSTRYHDSSMMKSAADSTADATTVGEQNGHLTPISEEKVPLQKSADCNANKTGSTLQNGDNHAQCEPMMDNDSIV
ncbi:secretin receptor-like isoform X1 [Haliotis rufescens]|uniref:secretin receptor-like isoform X1 n=1 Tax=Haliotis rufescens TaxID=6454 RepID=UPI001EB0459E|nr:secretin receptor-like isoform X1 [Haliotis rufescens]